METTFFIYLLKSTLCLSLFYFFYCLWLRDETFYRFNRYIVLGFVLLSLLIPALEIQSGPFAPQVTRFLEHLDMPERNEVQTLAMDEIQVMAKTVLPVEETKEVLGWNIHGWDYLWLLYVAGIILFAICYFMSMIHLCHLIRNSEMRDWQKGIKLVIHEQDISPFSWNRYIVLSRKDLNDNGEEILLHERAHICNRHFEDLLLMDICLLFQWFNPVMWLFRNELKAVHEFEADEWVLKRGVDARKYQLLLIEKSVGTRFYSMAHNLKHNLLKKRINMMLKEKSNSVNQLKYLVTLPLIAVATVLFACNVSGKNHQGANEVAVSDTLPSVLNDPLRPVRTFKEVYIAKSYAESDTVQILQLDSKKMNLPEGFIGWSTSQSYQDGSMTILTKAILKQDQGGILRFSSTIPWTKERLDTFTQEAKKSLLKSLNEIYGGNREARSTTLSNAYSTTSASTTTSSLITGTCDVKSFFSIYCQEDGGIEYDDQLILLDGKEISYEQLIKLSKDEDKQENIIGTYTVSAKSTGLEKNFGKKAKKGIWVLVSKENPTYWDDFKKQLMQN